MTIDVEFFGIPRARVGVGQTQVCVGQELASLGKVLWEVNQQFPAFADCCTPDGRRLRRGYVANVDGQRFLNDSEHELIAAGQSVLILSADAGG